MPPHCVRRPLGFTQFLPSIFRSNQLFGSVASFATPFVGDFMEDPAINVRNLSKSFRKRIGFLKSTQLWALTDVSFVVEKGETYGLLGPNGSGKSSLIRILSTLLIAEGGEVSLMGYSLPGEQEQVRRIIGRVSVDAAFYKKLSARENLLYTALLYGQKAGEAEKRAMEILKQLGLETTKFSTPLEEMSRGMQQKIRDRDVDRV